MCVGHDAFSSMVLKAPVVTLIARTGCSDTIRPPQSIVSMFVGNSACRNTEVRP